MAPRNRSRSSAILGKVPCYHGFPARESPSSRGPGRGPFKAKTRVRIPLGTPRHIALRIQSLRSSDGRDRRSSRTLVLSLLLSPAWPSRRTSAGFAGDVNQTVSEGARQGHNAATAAKRKGQTDPGFVPLESSSGEVHSTLDIMAVT